MKIDLLRGALLVARIDNDDLDVDAYVREVDRMAAAVRALLPPRADADARFKGDSTNICSSGSAFTGAAPIFTTGPTVT